MNALNSTIQDIRRYIFDLQIAEQNRVLETILENLVQDFRVETLLDMRLEVKGKRCCWLDSERVTHVTQIAREALSNVVQHSGATRVTVTLNYLGDATQLTVADNGKGMLPGTTGNGRGQGQGIANMRSRALLLGGDLALESEPGQGVSLQLTFPCGGHQDLERAPTEVQALWD
jgi:signal transduction histidine kinase